MKREEWRRKKKLLLLLFPVCALRLCFEKVKSHARIETEYGRHAHSGTIKCARIKMNTFLNTRRFPFGNIDSRFYLSTFGGCWERKRHIHIFFSFVRCCSIIIPLYFILLLFCYFFFRYFCAMPFFVVRYWPSAWNSMNTKMHTQANPLWNQPTRVNDMHAQNSRVYNRKTGPNEEINRKITSNCLHTFCLWFFFSFFLSSFHLEISFFSVCSNCYFF